MTTTQEVLKFYADSNNWVSPSKGFALQYDPEPSPIQKDRGSKAKEALEQPTQKPVAWLKDIDNAPIQTHDFADPNEKGAYPVYTHPAKQLSDDEMSEIFNQFDWKEVEIAGEHLDLFKFARAIEAKIRGK